MTYHAGWLYWTDALGAPVEFINHARTAAYLRTFGDDLGVSDVLVNGGCQAYALEPCHENPTTLARTEWVPYTFTTPDDAANPAPWWDGVIGSSASEALGLIIEEMTGLDGAHHTRATAPTGRGRGSRFGTLTHQHRTMKLNVLLMGSTERSLEHLFRWVEAQLMSCCDKRSVGNDLWIRTVCADIDNPEEGVYQMHGVALLDGPTYEAAPVEGSDGSWLRRISFTLGAADPCMYSTQVESVVADTLDISNIISTNPAFMPFGPFQSRPVPRVPPADTFMGSQRVIGQGIPSPTGRISPIVRIRTSNTGGCPELRVIGVADPYRYGTAALHSGNGQVVGQIELARLPASSEILIDFGQRTILFKDRTTGGYIPGWAFVTTTTGTLKRWASFGSCDDAYTIVELNSRFYDGVTLPGTIKDEDGDVMTFDDPTIDIWYSNVIGCC